MTTNPPTLPFVPHGEAHHHAKLSARLIPVIRARAAAREPYKAIAADAGVTISCICAIVKGRSWRHVA